MAPTQTSSPAQRAGPEGQRGPVGRAARRPRAGGDAQRTPRKSLAVASVGQPPQAAPVAIVRGRLVRVAKIGKPKRSRNFTPKQMVELVMAKEFLCRATGAAVEFQRRRLLVDTLEYLRVMGCPIVAYARFIGVSPGSLYEWAGRAKARGVESLHPWRGRACSEAERELLSL